MMNMITRLILTLSLLILSTANSYAQKVNFKEVFSGTKLATDIKFIPEQQGQVFIAEKGGKVLFADFNSKKTYTVTTLAVRDRSEMGVLGLAFHPQYPQVNKIYINYNPKDGEPRTRIAEFSVTQNNATYQISQEKVILEVEQPYFNHNGGQIAFGHDGYLYIGMGDGGKAGDPLGHGQNLTTLLGAMLRIDINTNEKPYLVPADNPFINKTDVLPEIWAYGLRNPWRFSFAPDGQLIAGDVGQSLYEEVSIIEKGKNYGWNIMEADHCFEPKDNCDQTGLSLPKISYPRDQGISITGGFVYTGEKIPALKSHYIYADFILGNIWAAKYPALEKPVKIFSGSYQFPTFAQDAAGEIYAADYPTGKVFQLVP